MKKLIFLLILISLFSAITVVPQTTETIRVGVFFDMTGATSSFGIASTNGIKLAVNEINDSGGINGKRLKIYLEDDEGRPENARTVVQKLINENKVHAILGEVSSTNSLAAAPVAQEAKIPMISPASTNMKVTEVGDYIFRTCFHDPFQGEAMAKFAFYQLKARRIAIFRDVTSDYSKGLSENFTSTFRKLGGKIVATETYAYRDQDFNSQLVKMRRQTPDALYIPGYYSEVGVIAKQARKLKMSIPLLGGDGWDSPELWKLGGNALNNTYITNHFAVDNQAAEVQNFVKKYEAKFKVKPDSLAALAYDSVYFLADAVRRAKSTDGDLIRNALAQTRNFSGVTGKILRLDENRNPVKPAVIQKLNTKTSDFVYQTTIEP